MEYRKISQEELDDILEKHEKWLNNQNGRERVNLRNVDLRYADLQNADLRYADLQNVDLSDADLRNVDLSDADLQNVDLSDADLRNADLRYADLQNVDLSFADLRSVDLSEADLRSVDLSDANLSFADLRSVDLQNVDLQNVKIYNTTFCNVKGKNIISIQLNTSEENRVINYIPEIDRVSAGCFHGTLEDLKNRVKDVHQDNEKIRKRYDKAIELIEFLKKDYEND